MKVLTTESNFLGITEPELYSYSNAKFVIQQLPYEHTSSYLQGSAKGPGAIISASHFVEFYDEELNMETYKQCGIATLEPVEFRKKVDAEAIALITNNTEELLNDKKFIISLGAEHTVTLGIVNAFAEKFPDISVLQIDAHSDLRYSYHDNHYSHASVMARIHEKGIKICQAGIRAQCREEAELIKNSPDIHTFYIHNIREDAAWMEKAVASLTDNVYITIDADGFDPSVIPAVGTAEPNGLFWNETLQFLKKVIQSKKVVGFDVVECAPVENQILSEYTLAKLVYRLIGYVVQNTNTLLSIQGDAEDLAFGGKK